MKRPFSSRSFVHLGLVLMLVMSSSILNKSVEDVDGSFLTERNFGSYRLGYSDCALNGTTVTNMTPLWNETSLLQSTSQSTLGDCLPRIVEPIEDSGNLEKNDIPLGFLSYKDSRYFQNLSQFPQIIAVPNGSENLISQSDTKPMTLWSKPLPEDITHVEARFRIIGENETDNDAGIVWNIGNKTYYAFLRASGLSIHNSEEKEFFRYDGVKRSIGEWSKLKIEYSRGDNKLNIYLDGLLRVHIPAKYGTSISQVGIGNNNNLAEFVPLKVGTDYVNLYRNGSNTVVSQNGETLYNGIDSTLGIQKAIDFATNYGSGVYMHDGLYGVREQINFTENLHFKGNGLKTILDYSSIENSNTIAMGNGSILENIMLNGSGTNLPMDFTQRLLAPDNSTIKNVTIANLGYGIDTRGSRNVTIEDVFCLQLRSKNDWAACINGGNNTDNVKVDRFRVFHSNRGIELDSGTSNFTAQNGYLVNITNSEATGHEAFSIDTHSHYGGGGTDNIIFKNIVIEKSRAPSVKATASVNMTEILEMGDFPRNILFDNITLLDPQSPWQINGVGIIIKNSTIVGSKENIFDVFEGSRNVTLNRLFIDFVEDEKYLISNINGPIFDIEIVNSTIKGGQDRTRPFVIFNGINGLTMIGNSILDVQYPKLEMLKNATNIHQRGNFLSSYHEKGKTDDS